MYLLCMPSCPPTICNYLIFDLLKAPLQRKANVSNFVFQETKLNDRQIRHIQLFFYDTLIFK